VSAPDLTIVTIIDDDSPTLVEPVFAAIAASVRDARAASSVRSIDIVVGVTGAMGDIPGIDGADRVESELVRTDPGRLGAFNQVGSHAASDLLLFLDANAYPAPTLLRELVVPFRDARVGAADARRLPMEHPKGYDPIDGDTGFASAGALTVRRSVFELVGGFDATCFPNLVGDVDLSWRIRALGFRTVHAPAAVIVTDDRIDGPAHDSSFEPAMARLLLSSKWDRDDVVDGFLRLIDVEGSPEQQRAAEQFRSLQAAGSLPQRVADARGVAEFVETKYARHRWEGPWLGQI
jgi:hypothetical protein